MLILFTNYIFVNSTRSPFRNRDNFWAHKTSLFPPLFFYWSACTCTMQGKWAVMYLYVREINIVSFYNFSIGHCNCFDSVVYFILFILYISVPDEGYFRNVSCALNLISTFLSLCCHVIYYSINNIVCSN